MRVCNGVLSLCVLMWWLCPAPCVGCHGMLCGAGCSSPTVGQSYLLLCLCFFLCLCPNARVQWCAVSVCPHVVVVSRSLCGMSWDAVWCGMLLSHSRSVLSVAVPVLLSMSLSECACAMVCCLCVSSCGGCVPLLVWDVMGCCVVRDAPLPQ